MSRILAIFLLTLVTVGAEQKSLNCKFQDLDWFYVGVQYTCQVVSNPKITKPLEEDIQVTGMHKSNRTNEDVKVFHIYGNHYQMAYFPRGLEKIFKHLMAVSITRMGLKEIHRADLEFWTEIEMLSLVRNELEILEENLFSGNRKLKYLYLSHNRIKFIDQTVFNNLNSLIELELEKNECIDRNGGSSEECKEVIQAAKESCTKKENL